MRINRLATLPLLALVSAGSPAGDLTVEGSLNVTSNLAALTLSATNATVDALTVRGDVSSQGVLAGADLFLGGTGRIIGGVGSDFASISNTACGAMQMGAFWGTQLIGDSASGASQYGWNDGYQVIGEWAQGASQQGYNCGYQAIGPAAIGAVQRGINCGDQSISNDSYGASQQGYNCGNQVIGPTANGAEQRGLNCGDQSVSSDSHGATQKGLNFGDQMIDAAAFGSTQAGENDGLQYIGMYSYGALQHGYNGGMQEIASDAAGAGQMGVNQGSQRVGAMAVGASQHGWNDGAMSVVTNAFGAEQRGYVAASAAATNSGKGSLQLLNLSGGQSALITGHASIGLGACRVTNDQAIVAGDGLASRGKGTVTAVRFFGDGSGLTNLTASVQTNSITSDKLVANAVSSAKILDATITDADLAANAAIAQSKIAGLPAAVLSLNGHLALTNNPHGVTAAQVNAYTAVQTDLVISQRLAQSNLGKCVLTNHAGNVTVTGTLSSRFAGDGWCLTNLNLAAYAGDRLAWDPTNKVLNAVGGVDSNSLLSVVSAIPAQGRSALGLGSAATNDASAFAPADLSRYASATVAYSNGQFQAAARFTAADVTNAVAVAWPQLDTDRANDLTTAGGTLAGELDMGGQRLKNLPAQQAQFPEDRDAISKAYLRAVLSCLPPQGNLSMGAYTNGAPPSSSYPLTF